MDNNPYQFPNPQGQQPTVPPPPPSQDAQVGIRSMQSDLESIKQSGGEAPQSQIINAPELAQFNEPAASPQPQYTPGAAPTPPIPPVPPSSPNNFSAAPEPMVPMGEITPKKSFSLKTILIIVGGIILAAAVGYGAYYLVTMLSAPPAVVVTPPATNLPVVPPPPVTTTTEVATPTAPVIIPLVHQSVILKPTKTETIQLADKSLASFEGALASSSKEKLIAGSVKDLAFIDASSTPVESSDIISAYFSSQAPAMTSLFDRDFTSWLYYDKVGGAKFGLVIPLKDSITIAQASSTLDPIIEGALPQIGTLFISNPSVPASVAFKDGVVNNMPVRFLVYNSKNSDVFEYGWITAGGKNYLVMATSYNQMVDITKRLNALPVPTTTATTTATTTNQ